MKTSSLIVLILVLASMCRNEKSDILVDGQTETSIVLQLSEVTRDAVATSYNDNFVIEKVLFEGDTLVCMYAFAGTGYYQMQMLAVPAEENAYDLYPIFRSSKITNPNSDLIATIKVPMSSIVQNRDSVIFNLMNSDWKSIASQIEFKK